MTPEPNAAITTAVTINAQPSTVWTFLADAERFLAWMAYLPGAPTPPGSVFEPRPGGQVRIVMPNGCEARGEVVTLEPPRRLVFTWGYAPDVAATGLGPGASRVELTLEPVPQGTRVTLRHSGPMSEATARNHEPGWRHYLAQLAVAAAQAHHQAHLEATLRDYFAACNEVDEAARAALLARACAPDIRVRTPFACADTREEFSGYIANGLRHLGDAVSLLDGTPRLIHGFCRVPWRVSTPGGAVMFRGENLLRFAPEGQIAEIVSFPGEG
ncbi:SRPBCC domain-containing protein [Nannocystis sp. SCPEA4]|uniref:SRPBCC family protein n=1 Tax=Nannocystis sp. SCPEA4 TaxID=2996787 RepID=UPI0022720006|nr:SRPBCC domain-containing protein [Nannocystis sp. SCPEA4]MCY1059155.1 SRPBCC domain-containing protein [Nannocystis sp. SCPEA4]